MDNRGKIIIVTLSCKCGCLIPGLGIYVLKNKLFNGNTDAFTLCIKLWCVHTLNSRDAIAEIPCMPNKKGNIKKINPLLGVCKKRNLPGLFWFFGKTQPPPPIYTCEPNP